MVLSVVWCLLTIDGCYLGDQNTWNTISVSEHKNTLNNRILNNWTNESNKRKQDEQQPNTNWHWTKETLNHWMLMKSRIMTVQYLQGLNILVIKELINVSLFAWMLIMRGQMSWCWFLCFPAGSLVAFWKTIEPPSSFVALYLTCQCSTSWVPQLQW